MNRDEAIAHLTAPGQPYELGTIDGPHGPLRTYVNAPAVLGELYAHAVSDAPFLVFDDERLTFGETYTAAARIAHLLVHEWGVRPGDRVAISMRNYPEWMLAFMAATSVGAVAVAMNSLWTAAEMEYGLHLCGVSVLFADAERLERLERCTPPADMRVVAVRTAAPSPGAVSLDDALARLGDAAMPAVEVQADDPAIILFTSGSTGHPKGVLSTHRNVIAALMSWELDLRQQQLRAAAPPAPPAHPPAALLGVPLFHVLGMHAVFLASFRARRRLVSMYKWDPAVAAALIERERITTFSGPPAMTGDLVREAQRSQRDLSSLVAVGGGGAARAPEQVRQIDATFRKAAPNTGWGMTETNAIGTTIGGADYLAHPMSAGRCLAVLDLRVVDELGRPLPPGERGELQIRGTSMFREYWKRPDATAEAHTADGWFRTGDVAEIDPEGYLYIVDRIKDLIIRGGENIGCGQVEAALLAHPQVIEAAVYAVPDERLGEEVAATLHAHPDLDLDQLRGFLSGRLAAYEVPRYLWLTPDPLPRTGSGKLFKRQLRDEAVARLSRGG